MLQLHGITKDYTAGDVTVQALKGVDLAFRDSEFVSILGPSGCGKTTLLNIIGGLDVYTSGDLIINAKSTKEFKDSDWDTYRNHSIGFVFQSYNLIPHQTVLSNVELALTLSGVSKQERRRRAKEALEKVGLGDQLHKRPNQMSGGQMQRVAIARALVNNPDILLADEPTGALDTETSVQIMEILKEISKDRLIIMVTHNPELAEEYSSRIVRLIDGRVTDDSNPFTPEEVTKATPAAVEKQKKQDAKGKKRMSFMTALSLSFNNLMTKRARTLLTSFAGSIGIIGIALILAVSTGVNAYIASVQRDTLSSYPISILKEENDIAAMLGAGADSAEGKTEHENDAVYSDPQLYQLFNTLFAAEKKQNNLTDFKAFLDKEMNPATATTDLSKYVSAIQYRYSMPLHVYVKNQAGEYVPCDLSEGLKNVGGDTSANENFYNMMSSNLAMINLWQEMLPGKNGELISDMIYEQYDLIYGAWPEAENEIVLIVNDKNEISDLAFYALGYMPEEEILSMLEAVLSGEKIPYSERKVEYADVLNIPLRVVLPGDFYQLNENTGIYDYVGDAALMKDKINASLTLKISGIIRQNDDAAGGSLSSPFGYTAALTEYLIEENGKTPVVLAQQDPKNENFDVLTGLPFTLTEENDLTNAKKAEKIKAYFAGLTAEEKTALYTKILQTPPEGYIENTVTEMMKGYDTREKMIAAIAENYGMSIEALTPYLKDYTDEELTAMMKEALSGMVEIAYATDAENRIHTLMNTPSEEELAFFAAQILQNPALASKEAKIGYITAAWSKATTMSAQEIMIYLASLDDAAFEKALMSVARTDAAALYAQYSDTMPNLAAAKFEKIAALFDAEYTNETDEEKLVSYYESYMPSKTSKKTLAENLATLGVISADTPSSINIYAVTFEDKDAIGEIIKTYNQSVDEKDRIEYTDYIALLLSGVTKIIDAISYVLIAFVSISLVVSSIMIGIITYISVLERTKEIGILRSIGASKRDVSLVFNAETIIVGLASGLFGIGISLLLCIPINLIIQTLSGISTLAAYLEPMHAVTLILISVVLTMIAGLFPSRMAARRDPVEALRTE